MERDMDMAASQYHTTEQDAEKQEATCSYEEPACDVHEQQLPLATEHQTGDTMSNELQQIIAELNEKRNKDSKLLGDFKAALDMQAHETYTLVEEKMYSVYEEQSALVQSDIDELLTVLQRTAFLENEYALFQQGLQAFFQDLSSESLPSSFQ